MSHRVYLNASVLPRMPNGANGEWAAFWTDDGQELEAKNAPPLLWWCLFSTADLRRALTVDDEDVGSEGRDDLLEDVSEEESYPYLVTDQKAALDRLRRRREQVLALIGLDKAPIYDAFATLIAERFGPFILVRTSGLIDVADAEPWLARTLAELEALDQGAAPGREVSGMAQEVRRALPEHHIWLLSGAGAADIWPTADLDTAGAKRRSENQQRLRQLADDHVAPKPAAKPIRTRNARTESIQEWLGSFVAAAAGLGTYYSTSSWVAAVGAFLVAALAVGVGIGWLRR
ncbi:hypothetical protein ACSBM8_02010 [Sphingomonas sp. ASY06-1R]|uniref:hypothetical protein n=1 Tax=Sphingomonas sp. ASY06-1R TaxID=3445771 RepID=UPI003FA33B73